MVEIDRAMSALESRRLVAVYQLVLEARDSVGKQFAERSVCEELRLARRTYRGECVSVVQTAVALHERYPELLSCLEEGSLDQYRAGQACEVLQSLTAEQAATAANRISQRLRTDERPFDWRSYVRRVADTVAPEAKQQRMTRARSERWARFDPGQDGAGMLLAQLPNETLTACANRIEARARSARTRGDRRNLEQLRADTLAELPLGEDGGHPQTRTMVNVHMALGTVLRLDEGEATIDGYGPIPAEVARELLANPDNVVRKVLTDPDTGAVAGLGRRRYRPNTRQRDYVRTRDRYCRTPGCTRTIAEIDHAEPWSRNGRTDPENLQGLCRLNHKLKSLPGWGHRFDQQTAELAVTTPTGRTYHSTPEPPPF